DITAHPHGIVPVNGLIHAVHPATPRADVEVDPMYLRERAVAGSDLARARSGLVDFPVRAQRQQLAVVVGFVGEHPFSGHLVSRRGDQDVADVGFFIAALVGVTENELDLVGRCNRLVPERRDGVASTMGLTLGVAMRWAE